jgi:hypothetical protein
MRREPEMDERAECGGGEGKGAGLEKRRDWFLSVPLGFHRILSTQATRA